MKLTYMIHGRKVDGAPDLSIPLHVNGFDPTEASPPVFKEEEAAKIAILEGIRLKNLDGAYKDYHIQAYDENGKPVERVDDKDCTAALADAEATSMTNPHAVSALSVMLASRQMYAVGVRELEKALEAGIPDASDGFNRPVHPLTIEVLLQAAASKAAQPFQEIDLFQGLTESILPWMQKLIAENVKQEKIDKMNEAKAGEAARKAVRVPIGIAIDTSEPASLLRDQKLVLVGYGPAVKYLLGLASTNTLVARDDKMPTGVFTVIRFYGEALDAPTENPFYIPLARKTWSGCCKNDKTFDEMFNATAVPQLKQMPDLLVVDDLAAAVPGMFVPGQGRISGGVLPADAADALKRLGKWTKNNGVAMLAGIPAPDERPIDLTASMWERLRTHAVLRPVTVVKGEGTKRTIVVGRLDLPIFSVEVDATVLEPVSQIILS